MQNSKDNIVIVEEKTAKRMKQVGNTILFSILALNLPPGSNSGGNASLMLLCTWSPDPVQSLSGSPQVHGPCRAQVPTTWGTEDLLPLLALPLAQVLCLLSGAGHVNLLH